LRRTPQLSGDASAPAPPFVSWGCIRRTKLALTNLFSTSSRKNPCMGRSRQCVRRGSVPGALAGHGPITSVDQRRQVNGGHRRPRPPAVSSLGPG
jgi:hypothetical protein